MFYSTCTCMISNIENIGCHNIVKLWHLLSMVYITQYIFILHTSSSFTLRYDTRSRDTSNSEFIGHIKKLVLLHNIILHIYYITYNGCEKHILIQTYGTLYHGSMDCIHLKYSNYKII